ncbi:MAG: hypothetical protein JXR76_19595 [Deltaproteobacteria bacterium]|nr:hypothetical protein [Deltaproteobacteria bacterium]
MLSTLKCTIQTIFAICLTCLCSGGIGCDTNKDSNSEHTTIPKHPADGVSSECGSVRMTQYTSSDSRWCGFDRTSPILPEFVRQGMTVAIAEPWNGSSWNGAPGEACGECWELATTFATQIVMVHDLCPIEGNPICAGSHFHFDVASEVAAKIDGGQWLGEAAVRRVPCPVTGNIHVQITARNQWGYMQLAFFNHRFPIREVAYRAADSAQWHPMERCLARWCQEEDKSTFSKGGPGGVFRLTSANGDVVEAREVLTYDVTEGSDFNTGVQFAEAASPEGVCPFTPPGDVFIDEWGGIEGVRWEYNDWGSTEVSDITSDCAAQSAACLQFKSFDGNGVHITYRHTFPKHIFRRVTVQLKSSSGKGTVEIAPRSKDAKCTSPSTFDVTGDWTTVAVNIDDSCPQTEWIHGLTISRSNGVGDLFVDNIEFTEN